MSPDNPRSAEQQMPRERTPRRSRMRRRFVAGAVAVLAASAGVGALAPSADAAETVGIKVDAGTSLGTVPSSGVGLNLGFGDEHMGDANVTSLMKAAEFGSCAIPAAPARTNTTGRPTPPATARAGSPPTPTSTAS